VLRFLSSNPRSAHIPENIDKLLGTREKTTKGPHATSQAEIKEKTPIGYEKQKTTLFRPDRLLNVPSILGHQRGKGQTQTFSHKTTTQQSRPWTGKTHKAWKERQGSKEKAKQKILLLHSRAQDVAQEKNRQIFMTEKKLREI